MANPNAHAENPGSRAPHLMLGTAGHIDHGKSSLILALTGTDPDRLSEEKQRGITITLGFAQLTLPDGRTMGVVDVPGHEKFVKQMIAGATGIDVALLVVAADDGVMPQTVEHVAVLETLGVTNCVVALTKIDLVDDEWADFMEGEVASWLSTTALAGAPIVRVSSKTGQGLDQLKEAIQAMCDKAHHINRGNELRFPVDRSFTIKGAGTVVTGTLWSGVAHPGDEVQILPAGTLTRVRSVQMHDTPVDAAPAGNRVALNLNNVKKSEVGLGDFICTPNTLEATDRMDVQLTYLDVAGTGKPLVTGCRMHIAHGTREVLGRVLLCDGRANLADKQTALAQIRLEEPLPVSYGDRFIVRTYSPVAVAGGGMVLEAHPRRRTNLTDDERAVLEELRRGDLAAAAVALVALRTQPQTGDQVAHVIGCEPEPVEDALLAAVGAGSLQALAPKGQDQRFFTTKRMVQKTTSAIERTLLSFHAKHPTERGMGKAELRAACAPDVDEVCFEGFLQAAIQAGKAQISGGLVGHPSSSGGAKAAEEEAAAKLEAALEAAGATPEALSHLLPEIVPQASLASRAFALLESQGKAVKVAKDLAFDAQVLDGLQQALRTWLQENGAGTAAQLRDVLGVSRKYAIPLLEYFDATGVTVRDGNLRRLR